LLLASALFRISAACASDTVREVETSVRSM
jgi:hypothetical protein